MHFKYVKELLLCSTICDITKGGNYLCQDAGETETERSNLCFAHKCKKERDINCIENTTTVIVGWLTPLSPVTVIYR